MVVSSLHRYSKMECFSYKGGYGVTRIESFKRKASVSYIHLYVALVINNVILFKTVVPVKN